MGHVFIKAELCMIAMVGVTGQKKRILLMRKKEKEAFGWGLAGWVEVHWGREERRPIRAETMTKQRHWPRGKPSWFGEWRQRKTQWKKRLEKTPHWLWRALHVRLRFFGLIVFFVFRDEPMAYGISQARDWIRPAAASLYHSHSNTRSEPRPWPTLQLLATLES